MDKGASYIRRKRKEDNFTRLPNAMLRDERLSWKARGLLAYMLSMPDDWVFYDSELVSHSKKDGITTLRTAVKELKEFGYLKKEPLRDELGKVVKWVTYIDDEPIQNTENLECGKPTMWENHNVENQTLLTTNSLLTNDDIQTTNKNNCSTTSNDEVDKQFETWWNTYGKKLAKPKALAAFKKVVKKHGYPKLLEQTMQYVEPFVKGQKDRQYQQHPQTFLNAYDPDNDYTPQKGGYQQNERFKRADDFDSFKARTGVDAPF